MERASIGDDLPKQYQIRGGWNGLSGDQSSPFTERMMACSRGTVPPLSGFVVRHLDQIYSEGSQTQRVSHRSPCSSGCSLSLGSKRHSGCDYVLLSS